MYGSYQSIGFIFHEYFIYKQNQQFFSECFRIVQWKTKKLEHYIDK